jgi:hypothetical protein
MNRTVVSVAAALALAAGCSGSSSPAPTTTATPTVLTSATTSTGSAPQRSVWLCRPDTSSDPCDGDLAATVTPYDGSAAVETTVSRPPRNLDCFYVYPTVSQQQQTNADLRIGPEQRAVAFAQAARFSDVCRVWAPMYRQRTVQGLFDLTGDTESANRIALDSLIATWDDYLSHHNDGHDIVFIGHSQGAAMLIRLLRERVDPDPELRARMALAILLGANVTVQTGNLTGGSFDHLPLCSRRGEVGCVIAYSSYLSEPPAFSFFGRPGLGVSALSGETADGTTSVACVNPAAVGGGRAELHPYLPRRLTSQFAPGLTPLLRDTTTPWLSLPDTYAGRCRTNGTATWLQVSPLHGDADPRAQLNESLGRPWGLHMVDVNLALGDLVDDVAAVARRLR